MRTLLSVTCPVRIESELNCRDHWSAKSARVKEQKHIVMLMLRTGKVVDRAAFCAPFVVRLTRIAPRSIHDSDNIISGCKAVRDSVAAFLGIDDADLLGDSRVRWLVEQEQGAAYALRIEIGKEEAICGRMAAC